MKKIISITIVLAITLVSVCSAMITVNAANPDLSALERIYLYDETVATDLNTDGWIIWCPPAGGDIVSTFTVEEGKVLQGFSFDAVPINGGFDLKIYSIPEAENCAWDDDQSAFKAAYSKAIAQAPVFQVLSQSVTEENPVFSAQSDAAQAAWGLRYGIISYKFDEPLPAGTYMYAYTLMSDNIIPIGSRSLSEASGLTYYKQPDGTIDRAALPIAHRASLYVSDASAILPSEPAEPVKQSWEFVEGKDAFIHFADTGDGAYTEIDGLTGSKLTPGIVDPFVCLSIKDISKCKYAVIYAYYETSKDVASIGSIRINATPGWTMYDNIEYQANKWVPYFIDLTSDVVTTWPDGAPVYSAGDAITEIRFRPLNIATDANAEGVNIYVNSVTFFESKDEALALVDSLTTDEPTTPPATDEPIAPPTGDISMIFIIVAAVVVLTVVAKKKLFA